MKKIAVITPGGDAPGMNACLRAVVRKAVACKFEVHGVLDGYMGLLTGDIYMMNARSVSGIIHRGGTILKSSRCAEIKTPEGMKTAVKTLKERKIDYLIVIGGDGSLAAGLKISEAGTRVIGIPASIDNDVAATDETIGFDTAVNTAVEAIDKIRDTATSFDRIFVVEVMGRQHGYLALDVGLASGAEFVVIPEVKYDIDAICADLKKDRINQKTSEIIVFAEGCGSSADFASQIIKKTGIDVKVSNLGYIQRGGSPTARSRNLAARFGSYALDLACRGVGNRIIVTRANRVGSVSLENAVFAKKPLDAGILKIIQELSV